MLRLLRSSVCAALLLCGGAQAHALDKVYNAQSAFLDNGMQVVVIPNTRAPVVSHMVWYKVGAADEPQGDGVSGAAHFLEHLMFKGSKALEPGEFSKTIKRYGGNDNAFTSWDYTAFFQSVRTEYLSKVMALEAERMINLTFPASDVLSERDVIIEERRSRTDNDPQALFAEQMRAVLFSSTPYAVPIIGWHDEMPLLKTDHVQNYYKTWYTPKNAILVVSGDVTLGDVLPLAKKYYGIIPSHDVPAHVRPLTPDFAAVSDLRLASPDIRQSVFMRAWRAPGFIMNKDESYALEVLCQALSGGADTELYQELVVKQKLATDVDLSYDPDARGESSIWLTAMPAPDVSLEKLEAALDAYLANLAKRGVAGDVIDNAKTRLINQETYARDSLMGPAMVVGQGLAMGMTLDEIETRPQKIGNVSAAQVNGVLKKYLDPVQPAHTPVNGFLTSASSGGEAQ
ncbi:MAG: pitrilysin family protein [Pseudobdellovibrionaceae bacterium]